MNAETWLLVHYYCRENGDRNIQYVRFFPSEEMARSDMISEAGRFRNSIKAKNILHDRESENRHDIDIRGGYNEFYTWEILRI